MGRFGGEAVPNDGAGPRAVSESGDGGPDLGGESTDPASPARTVAFSRLRIESLVTSSPRRGSGSSKGSKQHRELLININIGLYVKMDQVMCVHGGERRGQGKPNLLPPISHVVTEPFFSLAPPFAHIPRDRVGVGGTQNRCF